MKQKKLLFNLIGLCLLLGLSSCSDSEDDKSVFGDDFDSPQLTDANTIQFTVDATGERELLQLIGGGGRMAIEWGDGRLQKVENADANLMIYYKYRNRKVYRIRIWAEELDFCSIGTKMPPVSKLHLGYLPKMKELKLYNFSATPELDLSTSCPNVESINIAYWADLERIELSQCLKLKNIEIYDNPKLILPK